MTEVMWRCAGCGKWSHAKRRPSVHQRWIAQDDSYDSFPIPARIISIEEGYGGEFTDYVSGGAWIACGPLEEWRAEQA